MPSLSKFAFNFQTPRVWVKRFVNEQHTQSILKKWNTFAQKKAYSTSAKLLCMCVLIGSSVFVVNAKSIVCEDNHSSRKYEKTIQNSKYEKAIQKSRDLITKVKDEFGVPGMVVGVSIDGSVVWEEGFGYADVENRVPCTADTVMRIASISKSLTMAAIAKLWENGKLDLDKPIHDYVPYFPVKTFEGQPVSITCRHLVSHLGGIRHYDKNVPKSNSDKGNDISTKEDKDSKNLDLKKQSGNSEGNENKNKASEFEAKEYYLKDSFVDVKSALKLFQDDPLMSKPGSMFLYSTHGWTVLSAVVENASKERFPVHMKKLFKQLGMYHTYLDVHEALIYNRSRAYTKNKQGHVINAPYVDNSYKWAGGGFLSTVGDLLRFGNAMLYSLQYRPMSSVTLPNKSVSLVQNISEEKAPVHVENNILTIPQHEETGAQNLHSTKMLPGYLNYKTMDMMWSPITRTKVGEHYGMGWGVVPHGKNCEFCEELKFAAYHCGGAIGASSVVLILPQTCENTNPKQCKWSSPPKGIVVSIFANLQDVNLFSKAFEISLLFDRYSTGI